MPVDLNSLTEGWLELESDPGLFTLLLEDFGVRGVQVEEIYDLQKPIEGPVYGFIFLFKWIEERRSRRKIIVPDESFVQEEETVNSIFFAHQIVPNSCATHALLSVLLNCNKIHLGETLARLKEYTKNMSPENKGYAIGNTPELAKAHNSHAKPEPRRLHEKSHGIPTGRTVEAFHFVSYVPIGGQLFELDGLKPYPINHGPWDDHEDWTEKFRRVITERLGIATGDEPYHDIRFNLMAVVPDRRIAYEHKLRTLKTNRQIVLEALQHLVKMTNPKLTSDDQAEYMAAVIRSKQQANNSHGFTQENVEPQNEALCSSSTIDSVATNNSAKSNSTSNQIVTSSAAAYVASHPALDSHNYAKSPLMEGQQNEDDKARPRYEDYSGSEYTSDEEMGVGNGSSAEANLDVLSSSSSTSAHDRALMKPIHVNTKDYSHPLSIQTKFEASPTPSNSSTDTSSEVGSAFNSPVRTLAVGSAQNSPTFTNTRDIKKFVVIRMSSDKDPPEEDPSSFDASAPKSRVISSASDGGCGLRLNEKDSNCEPKRAETFKRVTGLKSSEAESVVKKVNISAPSDAKIKSTTLGLSNDNLTLADSSLCLNRHDLRHLSSSKLQEMDDGKEDSRRENAKYPKLIEPHSFAPKDLLALLKNVEHEISICENNLHEENEKRKKYKVDDCRRTHNYDRFICTFLKMLAQQGMLADLVRTNVLVKSRQGITVGRLHKKADRRRRTRPKRRK